MPTAKPRIAVTLPQETFDVLARLADLQDRSRGSVVAELLIEITPPLARTVALLEAAFAAPDQVKQGLRSVVEGVHQELVAVSGDGINQLDMLLEHLQSLPEDGSTPVSVTRGSGMDSQTTETPLKTPLNRSRKRSPAKLTKAQEEKEKRKLSEAQDMGLMGGGKRD